MNPSAPTSKTVYAEDRLHIRRGLTSNLARIVVPSDKWTKGQPLPSTSGRIDSTLTFCNKWTFSNISRWRRKERCKFRFSVSLAISLDLAALVAEGSSAASKMMRASETPSQTYITFISTGRKHHQTRLTYLHLSYGASARTVNMCPCANAYTGLMRRVSHHAMNAHPP